MSITGIGAMSTVNFEKVKKVKNSKAFTVVDIIIALTIVVIIAVSAWLIFRTPPTAVVISAPGYSNSFAIDTDVTVELDCITVVIKNGEVWATDADCPDKTCERTGKISRPGQSIVCLPNGVVVSIVGKSDLQGEVGR